MVSVEQKKLHRHSSVNNSLDLIIWSSDNKKTLKYRQTLASFSLCSCFLLRLRLVELKSVQSLFGRLFSRYYVSGFFDQLRSVKRSQVNIYLHSCDVMMSLPLQSEHKLWSRWNRLFFFLNFDFRLDLNQ